MSRLEQIENEIEALSPQELLQLRDWLAEHAPDLWDRQFESDVAAGKLDHLAQQALDDYFAGRTNEL